MNPKNNQINGDQKPDKKSPEPIKVMLADDDKDDQHLFEEALKKTHVPTNLTTADDGEQLMNHLHDDTVPNPDIIFLDINMPVKNGSECLEEIRADEQLKDIPVVMYSTSSSDRDISETYTKGANLYVIKPISFTRIVVVLKHIFTLKWNRLFTKPEKKDFVVSDRNVRD